MLYKLLHWQLTTVNSGTLNNYVIKCDSGTLHKFENYYLTITKKEKKCITLHVERLIFT